jgi:NADPH:quinone reductase-like Zn-dependent oxidoreductase
MRAITFAQYGGPEVLRQEEVATPEPGPGQVRVAVRTAGVNPIDWKIRAGGMAQGKPLEGVQTPGLELAGVVDALGDGAEFAVGDEVFGWSDTGSYAEYALATAVVRKPEALSWAQAVALPVSGETSLRVLRLLKVAEGDVLLIHGASGAVGRLATQLAIDLGATVVGTAGQPNLEDVKSLGAIPVLYGDGWLERVRQAAPKPVTAVFDATGYGVLADSVKLLAGTERLVTIADAAAFGMGITFSGGGVGGDGEDLRASMLKEVVERMVSGKLDIQLGRNYPLAEAADAQRESATGHSGGKITLTVA